MVHKSSGPDWPSSAKENSSPGELALEGAESTAGGIVGPAELARRREARQAGLEEKTGGAVTPGAELVLVSGGWSDPSSDGEPWPADVARRGAAVGSEDGGVVDLGWAFPAGPGRAGSGGARDDAKTLLVSKLVSGAEPVRGGPLGDLEAETADGAAGCRLAVGDGGSEW